MRSKGFTLIELIVVIAIIVVLAGILVPVVVGHVDSGTKVECRLQLKQIGLALQGENGMPGSMPNSSGQAFVADLFRKGIIQDVRILTCKGSDEALEDGWEVRAQKLLRETKTGAKVPEGAMSYWGRKGGGRSIRKARKKYPASQIPIACDGLVQDADGEWIGPHGAQVFVLYLDGHVEAVALDEFLAPEWNHLGEHPRKVLCK